MRAETMRIQKHNQQPAATCVGVRRTHSSALALGDMSVQAVNAPRMLPGARPALAVQVHSWQGAAHSVARSHTSVVSRWLVRPSATTRTLPTASRAASSAPSMQARTLSQISSGSCSHHLRRG